ncbi:MAG TPA: M14 family metallopeptidase [Thermoanaerobaculia bacterium]|nr:M14 family metallopeptidase [Thermoanaerobaculia bacterium]
MNFCLLLSAFCLSILPPAIPWNGKSRMLIAKPDDKWITVAEKTNFTATPNYTQTVAYLKQLTLAAPELRMISIGRSPEGRDIWMVIASRDHLFTPETLHRSMRPTVFVQAGIHAGEIDGKDAGLMLLRDLTVDNRWRSLLDRANLLFIPILNVDGHERASEFNRMNQRGPDVTGWRTNARNLNLNRDFTKLDTPEVRAVVAALDQWKPDLYMDIHVSDGSDYQYDITYGWDEAGYSPNAVRWLRSTLAPQVNSALRAMGHIPGPLISDDLSKGLTMAYLPPRFANGYGDARHIPSILVETHSLKPYDQRVLGTLVLLQSVLQIVGGEGPSLKRAAMSDSELRTDPVPMLFKVPDGSAEPEMIDLQLVESHTIPSQISGTTRIEYTGKPVTVRRAVYHQTEIAASVPRAKAYWIPPAWSDIVDRLKMHGVEVERISDARDVDVDMYRLRDPKFDAEPFEGHVRVSATPVVEHRRRHFLAGSFRVSTDQPLGDLVTLLLEPASADSFLQWGFFHSIFQRTEYGEAYVIEPMAEQMLASDPALKAEFEKRLATDEAFRDNPDARLDFFYSRSPYADPEWRLYPIARER